MNILNFCLLYRITYANFAMTCYKKVFFFAIITAPFIHLCLVCPRLCLCDVSLFRGYFRLFTNILKHLTVRLSLSPLTSPKING